MTSVASPARSITKIVRIASALLARDRKWSLSCERFASAARSELRRRGQTALTPKPVPADWLARYNADNRTQDEKMRESFWRTGNPNGVGRTPRRPQHEHESAGGSP